MDIDTIILKFEAVFGKMKSDLGSTIDKWKQLDNATSGVSNGFQKMADNANNAMNNISKSIDTSGAKRKLDDLKKQLNFEIGDYNKNLAEYKQWGMLATTKTPSSIVGMGGNELLQSFGEPITPQTLNEQKARIDDLKGKIQELETSIKNIPQPKLITNTEETSKNIKNVGNEADTASKKMNRLSSSGKNVKSEFSSMDKTFSGIGKSFSKFGNNLAKGMEHNFKHIKKLALGLIGVRTAMSLLTKGVNAYLSFDSELQDSISNSWNMLGALLAPAIELVANLFAMATNYIAQFVSALSGIDLVARANAKSLDTQAKAAKGASAAQRGLLSMDEITNLPTEPSGGGGDLAKQIKSINTKPIKWLNNLLKELKKHNWHKAGEIIAGAITDGLKKIDWDTIRKKAEQTGRNIATFLNGVFEVNWKLMGSSFANSLNTITDLLYGFFQDLEWGRLGAGLAYSINGFFEDFDFEKAAETVTEGIIGVIEAATAFISNLNVDEIANGIIDFVEKIDWVKIGDKIINLLIQGFRKALKANDSLYQRVVDDIKNQFNPKIEKLGEDIGGDFGKAIGSALKGALDFWLSSLRMQFNPMGVLKDLVNGTFSAFGATPPLATGTNEIEYEGLYHLHEGEAVVPKKYNPTTGGYDNGRDNQQIIDLLVSLNSTMLEFAERPTQVNIDGKRVAEATYPYTQQISKNRNYSSSVTRS